MLDIFRFEYNPYIGFEYENILKSDDPEQEGNILRLLVNIRISVLPLPKVFKEKVEFIFNYYWRNDIVDDIEKNDSSHTFFKASLLFKLFRDDFKSAGIGIDYVYGEDVYKGFKKQNFVQATLKLLL